VPSTSKEKSQISCKNHVIIFDETSYFYCQNLKSKIWEQTAELLKVDVSCESSA